MAAFPTEGGVHLSAQPHRVARVEGPGEPQDRPTRQFEPVLAHAVGLERRLVEVVGLAVELDGDAALRIGEVDAGQPSTARPVNAVLDRRDGQAGALQEIGDEPPEPAVGDRVDEADTIGLIKQFALPGA
jgi:hypothetical protein